ncbi:phosphatidylinositol-specific phospholipase C/glycerophosphodiester phosphodiesterase family protein [Longitalea arenae]|uniref:phosphatidylinositol-specific phospholipase C/glycerophosphodiester phosphodiesterase family protein n=1 Tax=Longitalea arenae TaxID=2812558 RepID=UPI001F0882E5|nr:phosphatidylinositol-specific phospholipase C/glycerophosphodiester phosphodiesterase family protein [Longitalea arenae]
MNKLLFSVILLISTASFAQPIIYTTANAHSHNDYEQSMPLMAAYNEQFGSIEADIFWHNGELLVAHTTRELALRRTLEDLYLKPLQALVEKNKGHVYADTNRRLQFMIDIKTEAVTTLAKLIELLQKYPALTECPSLRIAISGNRPDVTAYTSYPAFIWFDGELYKDYPASALSRIVMMSDNLKKYTSWTGNERMPAAQQDTLQQLVNRAHSKGKTVRFWAAPDNPNAWRQLMKLKVDYINTDSIRALAAFFEKEKQ